VTNRLPPVSAPDLIRVLERAGFVYHHSTGSHYYYRHPDRPGLVTVPFHRGRDLKRGTLHSILKQAGFAREEFLELLRS
jgi:predicted RNA binding protein YcfA (HicA-like mRNA interferase family)